MFRFKWLPLFIMLVVLIAGCSPSQEAGEVYTRITSATLSAGDDIPAPTGDVILTVTGAVGTTNAGDSIQMDLATIESLGVVEYTVMDPFEGVEATFRGVLMSDLLDLWQVGDDATTLSMIALNDYVVEVPIADLRTYPVIFAVQQDGEYMAIEERGPAMLVYPYDDFEFDQNVYNDYWIWQIKSAEVH